MYSSCKWKMEVEQTQLMNEHRRATTTTCQHMMYFHSSAARMVAPAVIGGSGLSSLSEPLIPKNDETLPEQEEEEAPIPLSSIGVIIGAVLLGAAG